MEVPISQQPLDRFGPNLVCRCLGARVQQDHIADAFGHTVPNLAAIKIKNGSAHISAIAGPIWNKLGVNQDDRGEVADAFRPGANAKPRHGNANLKTILGVLFKKVTSRLVIIIYSSAVSRDFFPSTTYLIFFFICPHKEKAYWSRGPAD